ncbi:MAG TPA: response regulator transcription factor [Micromonosporaceae bacterium]|jgi:two-component system response regulator MprA
MVPPAPTAHVLVVDDDEPILAALRRALEYEGLRVSLARDGYEALDRARRDPPDLVVLDVMLPGLSGIEVCGRLRDHRPQALVLMLTARDGTADRVRGLDAGADDYLVKPFAYEELLARVRALLRRRLPGPQTRLAFDDLVLEPLARQARRGGRALDLTALEFDLLAHFLIHPRQVLTRTQLLEAVWRMPAATASNVVDVYVGYLRTKLEAGGEPRLLHTVRGVGYVLRAPEPVPAAEGP